MVRVGAVAWSERFLFIVDQMFQMLIKMVVIVLMTTFSITVMFRHARICDPRSYRLVPFFLKFEEIVLQGPRVIIVLALLLE